MTVPYSVVIIKPMSVGRGDAPDILSAILDKCPVTLRMFRSMVLCGITLDALRHDHNRSIFPTTIKSPSWLCLFTHIDRVTDPNQVLDDYFGNLNPIEVLPGSLRHEFGGFQRFGPTAHLADDVVHLSHPTRANFEAYVLFKDFNAEDV